MESTMDEQSNQTQGHGEGPSSLIPVAESQSQSHVGEEKEESNEDDELIAKAQKLMEKITSSPDNPSPTVLHSLASLFETQESRYMEENGSSFSNGRASHSIGKLGNVVRENDGFFELISSKFLVETNYSMSIQAAAARLLLGCSLTWIYPHIFEEDVLDNIKKWVMEDTARSAAEDRNWKLELGEHEVLDSEMLRTYSTGLLAVCLAGGGPLVEDVLTSRLSAKLMRYLRTRVLGDTSQKDSSHLTETKNASGASGTKSREESRARVRQVQETSHFDDLRVADERAFGEQSKGRHVHEEELWIDGGGAPDELAGGVDSYDDDAEEENRWHTRDLHDGRTKFSDLDDNARDDCARRRLNRGRSRGKGKGNESSVDTEQDLTSTGSANRWRNARERSLLRNPDAKKIHDVNKNSSRVNTDDLAFEREETDDCFLECKIGTMDISDMVKRAVRAAEAEARAANAPSEAIKAVGDAAAEVVKSAALEEFRTSNNEEASVLAASRAASTVIDAANAIEVCRGVKSVNSGSSDIVDVIEKEKEKEKIEVEDFFIPNYELLAQLRERYCIQCLEILGEYVEVLGPVLHEKGVEVCLTLLQRSSKQNDTLKDGTFLPEVMKLICALAAHRKFAALFVDRGGIQKLLAVPRVTQNYFGLSSCLFTIASLQGIMERVCALPSDIVHQVVELAFQLLECPQDQARKNAALFFAAAFVFRAVIDAFDAQDGLQKVLRLLNEAASVRTGVNSGTLSFPVSGSMRNDRSPSEVLTSSEKQIAYHTCVALRQYFRAHLLLLVESIRPNKNNRSATRNIPSVRAVYKPLDISNEALDSVFLLLQKDRKLGAAFVRTRWPAVEKFLSSNGHIIMLELCQAPPVERYLHDLLQYALGVLHIVTLVPNSRRMIVNATLSNNRVGIAVILDAASVASNFMDPEIIQPSLNVLINLVCPPPSISNKPSLLAQGQQSVSANTSIGPALDTRDRNPDRNTSDRAVSVSSQGDQRDRNGESSYVERSSALILGSLPISNSTQTPVSTIASGLVGDRRITLGAGAGCAGLAAQLEQAYRQAREAVRANNGIKVLLHLLQPRIYSPPAALDCLRALACRVLLGLARDDTIAHILTKLQVGKKLSELIRDSGSQTTGTEQGRWQAELSQVAIELIAIVTNSGRASALAASDAATPTLRRIERAAIAAATPITYHSRELLLLIHEHLQASGMATTAATLLKEAQLIPLPSVAPPLSLGCQASMPEITSVLPQWPSGRSQGGFLTGKAKPTARTDESNSKCDSTVQISKKKPLIFSPSFGSQHRSQPKSSDLQPPSVRKVSSTMKQSFATADASQTVSVDADAHCKTPIVLPMKRKLSELKDNGSVSSSKRLNTSEQAFLTPSSLRKTSFAPDVEFCTPNANLRDQQGRSATGCLADNLDDIQNSYFHIGQVTPSSHSGALNDPQPSTTERLTLDSLVVQYLKQQHRQCPAPITTLPPLSLLNPHICPEPNRSLEAPLNITARLGSREFRNICGGIHGSRRDRQFVYSRFRPWRTCRDDVGALLTCCTFLADSSHVVVGSHSGEIKVFENNSSTVVESCASHQSPLTLVQSYRSGETQLLLSSSSQDVRLWDASSVSGGPMHSFDGCKAARFSNYGNIFAAMSTDLSQREILLYDVQTSNVELKLSDTSLNSTGRGHIFSLIHFSPSDSMLLWNGVLWDRRVSGAVHRFDQFTDYGGGGFHPAGNEVIINSEVWDLRKFRLLRSVPSLDQTALTFNARGDVIYAMLRRNLEDVMSAVQSRRSKHPLFAAFRTIDAVNYSDIATIPVDRCVLDFATEQTDSFVGLITLDDQQEMFSSARVYEIGRRKPTDDDSDPDDAESEEEDDDDEDDDLDVILGHDIDGDGDSDADDLGDDDDDSVTELDDDDEDAEFIMDGFDFNGGAGILDFESEGDEDGDGHGVGSFSSEDEEFFNGNFFRY